MRARGCFSSPRWVVALRGEGGDVLVLARWGLWVGNARQGRARANRCPSPETGGEKKKKKRHVPAKKKDERVGAKKAMPSGMPLHRQQRLHNVCMMSLFYTQAK